ncbi:MAG: LysM peptidoglycan-binding domain-containing protein [Chloroflexi bacterium]|nr:LysM peptidoglycan-binding domain-containing protein [Chloroflexota bacterium]
MRYLWKRLVALALVVLVLQLFLGATVASAQGGVWHCVTAGQTLFAIGRLYGANPWCIAQVNGLANPNYIRVGQWLWIGDQCLGWSAYRSAPPPTPPGPYYPPPWYYPPYWYWPYYGYGWGAWSWPWYTWYN